MQNVPVNSLKGYYGHTLGAAGILESMVTIAVHEGKYHDPHTWVHHTGNRKAGKYCERIKRATLHKCLKTASGFGGCNAALIIVNG